MIFGWLTSKPLATTLIALLAVVTFIAWLVIVIAVCARQPNRTRLAAAVEAAEPRLLDRLNTLVFLERLWDSVTAPSIARRIAKQTHEVLLQTRAQKLPAKGPGSPGSAGSGVLGSRRHPLLHLLAFVLLLTAVVFVYERYSPWQRLIAADEKRLAERARPDKPAELSLPPESNVEENQLWGEVRITDPGSDMRVTKVDVVPLQIEAAANQSLRRVSWQSTINGAEERRHDLPPPAEPRYAVYQPTIYLDEMRLSDWDVMTYYAKASTEKESSYASDVYFLEVRPFREDILKMPGGEAGKAYQCLSEMTALVGRQQHIIRQTHQHVQRPTEQPSVREQDRKKLAEAEGDLGDSVQHLYAEMATEMENKPIGEALDNLAKAQKSLAHASGLLQDNVMNEAQAGERTALTELVAARKMFQKAVSENAKDFEESKDDDEPTPVADASKKLNEMAEFRNEAKAAQDFVRKALEREREVARQAASTTRTNYSKLAADQTELRKSLEDFREQHPQVFKGTEPQADAAQAAMKKASDSLQKRSNESRADTRQAAEQMQKLAEAMQDRALGQQLADAYKLKQMLDKQIRTFDKASSGENAVPNNELAKNTDEARETLNQLKKVAEQEPTRDAFGQSLRDALNGQNKVDLDTKLNQLRQAQDAQAKQQRAGAARDALAKVSKAFDESEPKALQMARKSDSLKTDEQDSFQMGMSELESLLKQMEKDKQMPREDLAKQARESLFNLQTGMRAQYGSNERGEQTLLRLQEALKTDGPADVELIKKLAEELRHFSVETSDRLARKDDPEVTNIDPMRLPPAYRGRIQKYFQKLSEQ
jgi:hypothetical protein